MEKRGDINSDYTPPERPAKQEPGQTKKAADEQLEQHVTKRAADAASRRGEDKGKDI